MAAYEKFEAAWNRYIEMKQKFATACGNGRVKEHGARRSVLAARRNLDAVCAKLGVESPL